MIIIQATITTVLPLSISMPIAERTQENEFNNFPMMTRGLSDEGEKLETAYLPATTLRGYLRRAIVMKDMQAAADSGKHYKLEQAYSELIGQDAASEQQAGEIDLVALKDTRESAPVLDLFGSGLGIKSRLLVSHFVPKHNIDPDVITAVRKDLDDNEQAFELLADSEKAEFFERSQANSERSKVDALVNNLTRKLRAAKRDKEPTEEIEAQITEAKKLVEKYQTAMGEMRNSTRAIFSHYAIGAGIDLSGKLVIENPKDRDIDLLITGLQSLSLFPVLGANSARGCGEIKGEFEFQRDGERFKKVTVGGYQAAEIDDF
jgi:hypothetical protein